MSNAPHTRVDYCENSTISEAWAIILGLPGPVQRTEAAVLERRAGETIEDLTPKPAIVVVDASGDRVPPFWNQQMTWADGRYLARFGHRHLSVHFLRQGEDRYSRFAETLAPVIDNWLHIYTEAIGHESSKQNIDRIGFGYVNRFSFPVEGFDLSAYFAINVGASIGTPHAGLLGLTAAFRFYDPEKKMYLTVELLAELVHPDSSEVGVITKVFAEHRGVEGLTFADADALAEEIRSTKEAAKEVFFGVATEKTHAMMGVVHASAEP